MCRSKKPDSRPADEQSTLFALVCPGMSVNLICCKILVTQYRTFKNNKTTTLHNEIQSTTSKSPVEQKNQKSFGPLSFWRDASNYIPHSYLPNAQNCSKTNFYLNSVWKTFSNLSTKSPACMGSQVLFKNSLKTLLSKQIPKIQKKYNQPFKNSELLDNFGNVLFRFVIS